ncbi:MAG: MarR family winged helix-turn-helix transcriptional regulator [Pseudochelatococcus sp.]|uniref:MarR family winged helix-turn-helix transcriptional regulator n=1 Tax=Pseudochelatococcus sp. TaxID=2020869 RepID=UPI003D8B042C
MTRIATAMRADDWQRAKAAGVNPTQYAILDHLDGRPAGLSVKDLAFQLGVSQPTATDSIAALERKGLIVKHPDPVDRRSVNILLTEQGRAALEAGHAVTGIAEQAVASLVPDEQEHLLVTLIAMIRHMQETNAIPVQRMCVSCRYFRPHAHAGAARPHHCNFVDAAFGQQDLRIDCREHETADPSFRAATWNAFQKDRPSLQANEERGS